MKSIRIAGPVNEPGFRGYKVHVDEKHVYTTRLLRDAKAYCAALLGSGVAVRRAT